MRVSRNFLPILILLLSVFGLATAANAHRKSESYIFFSVTDESLTGRIEATLNDLDRMIPLDADGDGEITDEEFLAKSAEVFAFFQERVDIAHNGQSYPIVSTGFDFFGVPFGRFAKMEFTVEGLTQTPESVQVT
ncbi:MAG: hypothetical protein AAFO98_15445, partial [Pseudomonadota bacterium]